MNGIRVATLAMVVVVLAIAPVAAKDPGSGSMSLRVNAKSAVLMEVSTGTILFEQDADRPIAPASFTKILTLYLVFQGLHEGLIHLQDPVWISERAWRTPGSRMFIEVNTQVPLQELIKGIAVVSGNDACVAVAEHMYGSVEAFVDAMNKKAKEVGMKHSHFVNPNGLPADGQVTTARDMAILASAYIRRFPEALKYHSMTEYTYNHITQPNRNHLLKKDKAIDGLKTGYVSAAGYHLAATAKKQGMRLLAVVMGAAKPRIREAEAYKLLNYGFRHYTMIDPLPTDKPVKEVQVWKGKQDSCRLYPAHRVRFVIPRLNKDNYRVEVKVPQDITAPIAKGAVLGQAQVYVDGRLQATVPLISHQAIEHAGFAKRLWHSIVRVHVLDWNRFLVAGLLLLALLLVVFLVASSRSRRRRSQRRFTRK